jgi:hypothetical protein
MNSFLPLHCRQKIGFSSVAFTQATIFALIHPSLLQYSKKQHLERTCCTGCTKTPPSCIGVVVVVFVVANAEKWDF